MTPAADDSRLTPPSRLTPSCQRTYPRGCAVAGCPRPHRGRGYCGRHYGRLRRHGNPLGGGPVRERTVPGYAATHRQVRERRGPAAAQRCAGCGAAAVLWSYDGSDLDEQIEARRGRRYSLDPARYRASCRSCHRRATERGTEAGRLDIERAARLYRGGASARGIAALLDASPGTVLAALRAHGVPIRPRGRPPATRQPTDRSARSDDLSSRPAITDHDAPATRSSSTTRTRSADSITSDSPSAIDSNQTQIKSNDHSKNTSKSNDAKPLTDKAHQCIARSDGVVRALRARTGDQHRAAFKIVSAVVYEIVSEDF